MGFKTFLSNTELTEATEYYQGEYGFKYVEEEKSVNLKKFLKRFSVTELRKMYVQVKDLKLTNIVTIKLPGEDCAFLNLIVDKLSTMSESVNEDYNPTNIKKCN